MAPNSVGFFRQELSSVHSQLPTTFHPPSNPETLEDKQEMLVADLLEKPSNAFHKETLNAQHSAALSPTFPSARNPKPLPSRLRVPVANKVGAKGFGAGVGGEERWGRFDTRTMQVES